MMFDKNTANVRTDGRAKEEEHKHKAHVRTPLSHRKEIANDDIGHEVNAPAANALDDPAGNEHSAICSTARDSAT